MLKTMKKSNKLLIVFAIASFLIPVIVVAIGVKLNYKDAKEWASEAKNDDHFITPSNNMISKKLPAFSSINVNDGNEVFFIVRLIKDENTGVKITQSFEKLVDFNVDTNGKLQVSVKQKSQQSNYLSIFLYAPTFKNLELNNIDGFKLKTILDSLNLSVKKSGAVTFDSKTVISKLNFVASDVSTVDIFENGINSLSLNLKNTVFNSNSSFQNLNISSSGKSFITIQSYEELESIDQFTINTIDSASVFIENVNINRLSGSLSDQTTVQMPVLYLKQILKN